MDSDHKLISIWVICGTLLLTIITLSILLYSVVTSTRAISAGLVEGPVPGTSGTHWVKPASGN